MPALIIAIAIVIFLLHLVGSKKRRTIKEKLELFLVYLIFFCFGIQGVIGFIAHVFFSDQTAALIGWQPGSPFQFEVGIANLGFGILGILCAWRKHGFWIATMLGNTIWLWGDAVGHIKQMIILKDFAPGNSGIYFFSDIIFPIAIWIVYYFFQKAHQKRKTT